MNTAADTENSQWRDLLDAWNPPTPVYGLPMFIHHEFEEWARKQPDATAIISQEETLSYAELELRSNQLAWHLQSLGAGPEVPVALCFERSVDFIVGLLAIAKSGGACVFLDPSYPPHRLAKMLKESGAPLLVTRSSTARALPQHEAIVIAVDSDRENIAANPSHAVCANIQPGNLSCIFFTSGSTGVPKAVMWQYTRTVAPPSVNSTQRPKPITTQAGDRHLFKASVGFTLVSLEVHTPLRTGGTVVIIPPGQEQDPKFLVSQLHAHRVISIALVPTLLQLILEEPQLAHCSSLKEIFCFGEKLSPRLCQEVFARTKAQLTMVYGLTEAPSATSWTALDAPSLRPSAVGFVNPSRRVYVLDAELQPLPQGATGELFVGGNISRGYAGRPAYTAERFLPDPFSSVPGARMYRSGDHGRFAADGMLEFVGREDDQIKVRGFRVEIAEIETSLAEHPQVRNTVVIAHEGGEAGTLLTAYYDVRDSSSPPPDESELLRYLRAQLPSFMVPARVVRLDAFPVNRNGKLDRAALPLPDKLTPRSNSPTVAPRTPVEASLCGIWAEILDRSSIGIHDDFFDLGGHSIDAARITARARQTFDIDLSVTELFNHSTIAELSEQIGNLKSAPPSALPLLPPIIPTCSLDPDAPMPTSCCQRSMVKENERAIARQAPPNAGIFHFALRGAFQLAAFTAALREVLRRHHLLRTLYQRDAARVWQKVESVDVFQIEFIDATSPSPSDLAERAKEIHQRHACTHFDLFNDLPLRATLLRGNDVLHHLILSMHHVVYDQVTSRCLFQELWLLYASFAKSNPSPLAEPVLQYGDYAAWESAWVRRGTPRYEALASFWLNQLADAPPSPEFMLATNHPVSQLTLEDSVHPIALAPDSIAQLRQFAREEKATVFMVFLAAVKAVFNLAGGFEDIIIATFVDSRTHPELNNLFGCFIRNVALRTKVHSGLTFSQLLQRVRSTCLDAFAHQDLPADKIGDTLRRAGKSPLHIRSAIQILESNQVTINPTELEIQRIEFGTSFPIGDTDFFIQLTDDGETISGNLYSGSGRLCPRGLRSFTTALTAFISKAISAPHTKLNELTGITASLQAERRDAPPMPPCSN